jgi:uncharacterized membrane protein
MSDGEAREAGASSPPTFTPETAVLPDPLHPMIVHFPVVLSVLLPFAAFGALWGIKSGARPLRAWAVAIAAATALSLSAWVAVETGEDQESRVEQVVGEARLDAHAEAGQTLLYTSVGVLAVLALGLMPGDRGRMARVAGAVSTLAVGVVAYQVGHTGGDMVYKYNAASAYTAGGAAANGEAGAAGAAADAKGEKNEKGEKGEKGESAERSER